ncbi:hypothetical protein Rhal01_02425 [Rubritalea halochordaticola]|uniref:DUF4352 domain-containing protein n=1 Tax=Rubritalea halochordaticola TaxID=714537 RepID=A0ABP9V0P8_9BACT
MMKSFFAACAAVSLFSMVSAAEVQTKEGKCVLQESNGFDKGKVIQVEVGKVVKGTCKFYLSDFFGKKIINANIDIKNTADKPMHCHYYVAFFSESGELIGCAGQGSFSKEGLAAGEKTTLGSCLIPVPEGFHEKAVSYKITFYEDEKQIGKK